MAEALAEIDNPAVWALGLVVLGAGAVLLAKIYGLVFMRGKTPHRIGEAMHVSRAEVTEWSGHEGLVTAGGELWRATSSEALCPGDQVTVAAMKGLVLKVKKKKA